MSRRGAPPATRCDTLEQPELEHDSNSHAPALPPHRHRRNGDGKPRRSPARRRASRDRLGREAVADHQGQLHQAGRALRRNRARYSAAVSPAGPPPTITTACSFVDNSASRSNDSRSVMPRIVRRRQALAARPGAGYILAMAREPCVSPLRPPPGGLFRAPMPTAAAPDHPPCPLPTSLATSLSLTRR